LSTSSGPVQGFPCEFGRYTLLERLGIGGMAEVFRAEQRGVQGFSKEVVIKRILPHLAEDPRFVDMFLREARLAAGVNHPNVVQIFDVGEIGGAYYIAMERVNGLTVRALARRMWRAGQDLPLEVACGVIADAAQGLDVIHSAKDTLGKPLHIVHRDISPDNLMLSRDGTTKILDFGIARSKDAKRLTQTGELKGKIPYMPPEQIESKELDGRCDLYALGISLYWLLTRSRPFDRPSDLATLNSIIKDSPPPPRAKNPDIPPALEILILQLLEKDPERRPATGREVHDRILRAVPGAAVPEALIEEACALPSARFVDDTESVDVFPEHEPAASPAPTMPDTVPVSVVSASELLPPEEEPSTATIVDAGLGTRPRSFRAAGIVLAVLAVALTAYALVAMQPEEAEPPVVVGPTAEELEAEIKAKVAAQLEAQLKEKLAEKLPGEVKVTVEDEPKPVVRKKKKARTRKWSVKAPGHIRWTYQGKTVGKGSATLNLPAGAKKVTAYDPRRRVKTPVRLKDNVDYASLPKGRLAFRVHPFATVTLGTESLGTTPFPTLVVVAGRYEAVKLAGPGRTETRAVTVNAGAISTVKADLSE
jgi:serine/threonine-protein kinase